MDDCLETGKGTTTCFLAVSYKEASMDYGILTLLPPFAMLIFAVKTKKSFEALVFGSLIAYIIMYGYQFMRPWCELILAEISNADNEYILLICGLFGSLVLLLKEAKGTQGFSKVVAKICKTERMVLIGATIMGLLIFVDDYLNIMTVGTCMKDVCDKRRIPRESLAYIIDSTGAPVCALLPFSTWAVFYAGIFYQESSVVSLGYGSGLKTYIYAIPYMFYPIFTLLIVVLFSVGIIPKVGAMKRVYEKNSERYNSIKSCDEGENKTEGEVIDFLIPVTTLITITIITGDMLIAIVSTLFVCLVFYLFRKKMTFSRYGELFLAGFADMIPVLAILFGSFLVRGACREMNLSEYVILLVKPILNAQILPVIIFLIIAGLTFVTSSFWGIEAIALPIVVPLAVALNANILLVLAAVVSGGVFGSHACFYSDATVLSSATCEIDNMSHAITQLPYAIGGAVLASLAYIICGFIL